MNEEKGFTLFETLIALAIIAIALTAVLRASAQAGENAYDLRQRMLADWVAQNRMAEITALQIWPDFGKLSGTETEANEDFSWEEEITSTPNPLFRKIVISVYDGQQHMLRQLTGYLIRPMP